VRIVAALEGDLEKHMADESEGAKEAVTGAVREAGEGLKRDWRGQVTAARLGQRLANTIRSQHYPKGRKSISAAALVYSRAPKLIDAFDRGVTIRARNGLWLAIPTPAAGRARGGTRITPGQWEQRTGVACRRCSWRTRRASRNAGWRWQVGAKPDAAP